MGRSAHRRRGHEPVRLLQVPLLREVAGRDHPVLPRQGYITEEELAERIADFTPPSGDEGDAGIDDQVIAYLRLGDSPRRDVAHPKFAVGSAVRIANVPADAHSRLPGYLRGHVGMVERVFEGDYAYFCHTGDGIGDPMPIYIVAFEPTDIWGARAEEGRSPSTPNSSRPIWNH